MKRKLLLIIFCLTGSASSVQLTYNHETQEHNAAVFNADQEPVYDEFDSATDTLLEKGHTFEQPAEPSRMVILLRKIGGGIFLKYLAVKHWVAYKWQRLFAPAMVHAKDCPYYKPAS